MAGLALTIFLALNPTLLKKATICLEERCSSLPGAGTNPTEAQYSGFTMKTALHTTNHYIEVIWIYNIFIGMQVWP